MAWWFLTSIRSDATVAEAIKTMHDRRMQSLIVVEAGEPIGILSEREILGKVIYPEKNPSELKVSEVMSKLAETYITMPRVNVREVMSEPVVVTEGEKVTEVVEKMSEKESGVAVVVRDEKPIGIFTERDIITNVWGKLKAEETPVEAVMTRIFVALEPEMDIMEAARQMKGKSAMYSPVVHEGKTIGVLSGGDIIRLIAKL
ncbi:MAG: cyclic nucleotide-binding/CBS domain-containing protein [Candidatus Hodarchaeota archaeon]